MPVAGPATSPLLLSAWLAPRTQKVAFTFRQLRPHLEALPRGELDTLTREPAVLGCFHLGCTNRAPGGASEPELLLRPCEDCAGPKYCSRECAEAARRERHGLACRWNLSRLGA